MVELKSGLALPADPELTATAVGTNEVLLEWTIPEGNGSNFEGYVIQRWDPSVAVTPAWGGDIAIS